jgi:hypothetical protein
MPTALVGHTASVYELSDERREEPKGVLTVDSGKAESHLAGKVRQVVEDVLNVKLWASSFPKLNGSAAWRISTAT